MPNPPTRDRVKPDQVNTTPLRRPEWIRESKTQKSCSEGARFTKFVTTRGCVSAGNALRMSTAAVAPGLREEMPPRNRRELIAHHAH